MKTVLVLAILTLLGIAGYEGHEAYKWKHWTEQHANLSLAAGAYLFAPTEYRDAAGKPLRRVDLIDAALAQALKNASK